MLKVCGPKIVTTDSLKRETTTSLSTEQTLLFWQVVDGFSDGERSKLLEFATGQARLPLKAGQKMSVRGGTTDRQSNGSYALPTAATCSFSMTLPLYPSAEVMRERLLTAIYSCCFIDADGRTGTIVGLPAD